MSYINGTSYNNFLTGTSSSDSIYGLGGDDRIDGQDGNDSVHGGDGNDYVCGGDGVGDSIYGGNGNDYLISWGYGGNWNAAVNAPKWYDGGSGNDTMVAVWSPKVFMQGGSGWDQFRITGKNMHVSLPDLDFNGGEKITLVNDSTCHYNPSAMSIQGYSNGPTSGTRFYDSSNNLTIDVRWLNPSQASTSIFNVA